MCMVKSIKTLVFILLFGNCGGLFCDVELNDLDDIIFDDTEELADMLPEDAEFIKYLKERVGNLTIPEMELATEDAKSGVRAITGERDSLHDQLAIFRQEAEDLIKDERAFRAKMKALEAVLPAGKGSVFEKIDDIVYEIKALKNLRELRKDNSYEVSKAGFAIGCSLLSMVATGAAFLVYLNKKDSQLSGI